MNQEETKDREALFDLIHGVKILINEAGPMRTILGKAYVSAIDKAVNDMASELFDDRRPKFICTKINPSQFSNVYCSQCGSDFGPGEQGFSDCESHAGVYAP